VSVAGRPTGICPSLLSADFTRLGEEVARIADADWVHVDVMDNHFVPNLTIGPPVVAALRGVSPLPLDAHLMIEDPDRWALSYVEAGAHHVTVHAEAVRAPVRLAREVRRAGATVGIAVEPATPVEPWADLLGEIDLLLVMTVEPGFGGQEFLEPVLAKVRRARELVDAAGAEVSIQVDGGVSAATVARAAAAGADAFVAGSAVFGGGDPAGAVDELRALAAAARPGGRTTASTGRTPPGRPPGPAPG
jgi:ribulose-phosphate 3-epimerase